MKDKDGITGQFTLGSEETVWPGENLLVNIFKSIQESLLITDNNFNILLVNKKAEEAFSAYKPLVGKKCFEILNRKNKICAVCPYSQTTAVGPSANALVSVKDQCGRIISWLDHHCHPFFDMATGHQKGVIVYIRDITEKVKIEREIARLDRFNLMGQFAASISHEIRNPMTIVLSYLQMLRDKEEYLTDREYFDLMIRELDRANLIITEYLSITRNNPVDFTKKNLNLIVKALSPLIRSHASKSGSDVMAELGDIPDILFNENNMRQLILNLARNGLEAMEYGGKLTISTFWEGKEVVLSVQDEGGGISEDIVDKIGTPFFTTKENGTGIGLMVCHSIAALHNAAINFKSDNTGTTFYVRFKPVSADDVSIADR